MPRPTSKPPRGPALPNNRRTPSMPPRGGRPASVPPGGAPGRNRRVSPAPPAPRGSRATALGALLGAILGAGGLATVTWASGCGNDGAPPPGPIVDAPPATSGDTVAAVPSAPLPEEENAPLVEEPDRLEAEEDEPPKPWTGPWLGAMAQATPIYPTARFSKNRLGYIRRGGKVPVEDKPIVTSSCKQGFYPLVDGGYVCGKYATLDLDHPRVKMGVKPPDLEGLLPYKYAYNRAHGTPLYSAVPSKEEMFRYEPYLQKKDKDAKAKKSKAAEEQEAEAIAEKADQPRPAADGQAREPASDGEAAAERKVKGEPPSQDGTGQFLQNGELTPPEDRSAEGGSGGGAPEEPEVPWWQKDKGEEINVKLSDLEESDGTIAKRMVKGFFIAIDRTFGWNDRLWYKTTDGLIAPTDRMLIPKIPDLKGIEMGDGVKQVGFVLASKAFQHERVDGGRMKRGSSLKRFTAVALTGETHLFEKRRYRETKEGWWLRDQDSTWTEPGPRPSGVAADEKWIDVNLGKKTLVAFEGDRPVYAALISPGKRSKIRKRDHRTKVGKWRIREKHLSTTMDGDGPAGDLPYSIQDVPFVQYYDGSYAVHGAFWHNNFGREQSHGCINLAPNDAKHLFFWTDPPLPRGWHGVWSSDKRKGTMVVVHE